MAIIDLNTKEVNETQPQEAARGQIIDLQTGLFVDPQQPVTSKAIPPVPTAQSVTTQPQQGDRTLLDSVGGGLNAAATIVGSVVGSAVGGSTALVDLLNPFTDNDPVKLLEEIKSKFGVAPNEGAQAAFNKINNIIEPVKPLINILTEFRDTAADQGLEMGGPMVATFMRMLPDLALELSAPIVGRIAGNVTEAGRLANKANLGQSKEFQLNPNTSVQSEIRTAEVGRKAASALDVDLFKAQQTLNPSDLDIQSFLPSLPPASVKARERLSTQNTQVLGAVDSVLNKIANPESIGDAAGQVRTTAQKSVAAIKSIRSEAASPIYKQAARRQRQGKLGLIDTSALETKINSMIDQFDPDGEISKNLTMASKKIKGAKGDLQKLHNAKMEIDQTINAFASNSVGNTTKRFLSDVQRDLTDNLTTQSPSYRAAKAEFERLSPAVEKIQDSPIGQISNLTDVELKSVSTKIFDPQQTNPKVILDSKKAITDIDPSAWQAITRAEIERRMGRIRADIAKDGSVSSVENIPSQLFNSIYGNKKSRDVLYAALDGDTKANMKYLETVLKRATAGRPGGSQTGSRNVIQSSLRGGVTQSIRDWIKGPINQAASIGEEVAYNSRVKALAEVMFDPTWKADMKKLKSLPSRSDAARNAMDRLLNIALISSPAVIEDETINPQQEEN